MCVPSHLKSESTRNLSPPKGGRLHMTGLDHIDCKPSFYFKPFQQYFDLEAPQMVEVVSQALAPASRSHRTSRER